MNAIEVCGNDLDWCEKDRCILCINGESFEAEKFGYFDQEDDAPDYGCASFHFEIDNRQFANICNKFELSREEEASIRDRITSNWWGGTCAWCE